MKYRVRARLKPGMEAAFFGVLTDGSVRSQQPDGEAMHAAMRSAKLVGDGVIEWYEACYCETPLKHERETVYDRYLSDMETELVDRFGHVEGDSFWDYLEGATGAGS